MASPKSPRSRRNVDIAVSALLGDWLVHRHGNAWRSVCPIHDGADNPTAFRVEAGGYWRCFACGEHGPLTRLVMLLDGVSFSQAQEILDDLPSEKHSIPEGWSMPATWAEAKALLTKYPVLPEETLLDFKGNCPMYLVYRGFDPPLLRRYEIGYSYDEQRVVFPVRDIKGQLVGKTTRRDHDEEDGTPKYRHDVFSKSQHLYGLHLHREVPALYICEGQLDSIRLTQLGQPAVAIMGSAISLAQADLLHRVKTSQYVLMLDNDEAGQKGTDRCLSLLVRMPAIARKLYVASYEGDDPGGLDSLKHIQVVPWLQRQLALV